VPNRRKLYEYLFMMVGTWQISPRKWFVRMAPRAFWYPSGEKDASMTARMDWAVDSSSSSSRIPKGRRRNSGFDQARHSLAFMGYETFFLSSAVNLERTLFTALTIFSISTPSSCNGNKSGMMLPSDVIPLNGSW